MKVEALENLLRAVAEGSTAPDAALEALKTLPFREAGATLLDTHRSLRTGMPEVVYARSKTTVQVGDALQGLHVAHGHALATTVSAEMAQALGERFPSGRFDAVSRLFSLGQMPRRNACGSVAVVCAGTSDLPVAEEAAQTLEFAGVSVQRVRDVGVAGLHRLLSKLDALRASRIIIAVAGMEGALPGVLAGLVAQPVIAVPTSVGYGASFGGVSALLSMLNSCSSGMGVVNIDNGFGAAMLAIRMLGPASPETYKDG